MKYTIIYLSILLMDICFASRWGSYKQHCCDCPFTYITVPIMDTQEQNSEVARHVQP